MKGKKKSSQALQEHDWSKRRNKNKNKNAVPRVVSKFWERKYNHILQVSPKRQREQSPHPFLFILALGKDPQHQNYQN